MITQQSKPITLTPQAFAAAKLEAHAKGIITGMTRFAYTVNGKQVVGNKGHSLADAIKEIEQEYQLTK